MYVKEVNFIAICVIHMKCCCANKQEQVIKNKIIRKKIGVPYYLERFFILVLI